MLNLHIAVVGIRILLAIVINVATFSFFGKVYKPKYDNKIFYIAMEYRLLERMIQVVSQM